MKIRKFFSGFMVLVASCVSVFADGPKISILGDSYSTFKGAIPESYSCWYIPPRNGITEVGQTWWMQVINGLGGTLETNNSFSGSTICYTGYNKCNASASSFVTRASGLGNPDIILICGGTNDAWAKSPIGNYKYSDWTEEDLFSFRPAMAKMLSDIKTQYPAAKVYFILNDMIGKDVPESAKKICFHYGVPCIQLKFKEGEKPSGHPNLEGMKNFASQVLKAVKMKK